MRIVWFPPAIDARPVYIRALENSVAPADSRWISFDDDASVRRTRLRLSLERSWALTGYRPQQPESPDGLGPGHRALHLQAHLERGSKGSTRAPLAGWAEPR